MVLMEVRELVAELSRRGVKLEVTGDKLRARAPRGAITAALRQSLRDHKVELLAWLESRDRITAGSEAITRVSRDQDLPLSYAQQRLWFLQHLEPDSVAYSIPRAVRFTGQLNYRVFQQAWEYLVRRHESLRTTFHEHSGEPVQRIHDAWPLDLPVVELSQLPDHALQTHVEQLFFEEAHLPFDLSQGPLLRLRLLRLSDQQHVLLLNMHHIVTDVWSANILYREFSLLYDALLCGQTPPLDELPIQYADYAAWQRLSLDGPRLQRHLDYWRDLLRDAPQVDLPTDRLRPSKPRNHGAREVLVLDEALSKSLGELGQGGRATRFMTLFAAFNTLLHRYTGAMDLVVGSPVSGRDRSEVEGLVGFFVNSLPLRTDLSGDPTFRELLTRVRKSTWQALAHCELPFERLVDELRPQRRSSQYAFFQAMFVVQDARVKDMQLSGLEVAEFATNTATSRFDLEFHVWEDQKSLVLVLYYDVELFAASTIRRVLRHYQILLQQIVAHPDRPISTLRLTDEEQRQCLLHDWGRAASDYPAEATIHELLERQANRTPHAIAVDYNGRTLTFSQLNARANQLAQELRQNGVGPETIVGICVERSPEMVLGILGILKAGGAYLPLDPDYPQKRLAHMMDDARLGVLLSLSSLRARLAGFSGQLIYLDADWPAISQQPDVAPDCHATARSLAYVIYTSGSTGYPKGTCVEHRSVVRLVKNTNYIDLNAEHVVAQASTLSFDAATFEVWGALLNGAKLLGVSKETALSADHLVAQIESDGITTLFLTTALFNQIARQKATGVSPSSASLVRGRTGRPELRERGARAGATATFPARLRTDRDHDVRLVVCDQNGATCRGNRADWRAHFQHRAVCAGPALGTAAARRAGRALHWRSRGGPRLLEPTRVDRRTIHRGSVSTPRPGTALQDRRSSALVGGRRHRIPGS